MNQLPQDDAFHIDEHVLSALEETNAKNERNVYELVYSLLKRRGIRVGIEMHRDIVTRTKHYDDEVRKITDPDLDDPDVGEKYRISSLYQNALIQFTDHLIKAIRQIQREREEQGKS
jgi:hypothetical protein